MAKKKDNGEAQIESTFPPAPKLVDAPEVPEIPMGAPVGAPQQPQYNVADECPVPRALSVLINNSNTTLQQTQQRLMTDINESANELMGMMELSSEEGWLLDIEGQRFVRVEPVQ
jgi:hypothetical protein